MEQLTVKRWFEGITDPEIREKALRNLETPASKTDSLASAISSGFVWDQTPERNQYWLDIHSRAIAYDVVSTASRTMQTELWLRHIEDLEIREKAINNFKAYCTERDLVPSNHTSISLNDSIDKGMKWNDTPEGSDYWDAVHEEARDKGRVVSRKPKEVLTEWEGLPI